MVNRVFASFLCVALLSSSAFASQMLCQSGLHRVTLLEGGYMRTSGMDALGWPSNALWRCAGVKVTRFGAVETAEHYCESVAIAKQTMMYTHSGPTGISLQIFSGLGFPFFNGICRFQKSSKTEPLRARR